MDGVESGYSAKTADPLRSCGAPVGMTRRGQLLFGRVATWMDGVEGGYSAKTADPLRSCGAPVRMTRRGQLLFGKSGDLDGRS